MAEAVWLARLVIGCSRKWFVCLRIVEFPFFFLTAHYEDKVYVQFAAPAATTSIFLVVKAPRLGTASAAAFSPFAFVADAES